MQSPSVVIGAGLGNPVGSARLSPGERFQVIHFGLGTIRYRYGGSASPPLYVALVGAGPILVHPGQEVFIEVLQAAGTEAFIHKVGGVIENPGLYGWSI